MFYMLTTDGYVTIKTELNILSKNFTTCKLYLNKQEHKKNHAQWNHLIWSETSKSSINSRFLYCILLVFFVNYHCQCVVIIEFLMQLDVKSEIRFHISSVQFSHSVVSNSLRPHESQHTRPPCPWPTPGIYSNSCLLSRSCRPAILSAVVPFSSCLLLLLGLGAGE